jgi:hypothetical protein
MRTLLTLFLCLPLLARAQTVTGRWTTIDDETGKKRSVVELTERDGKLHGRIVQLFRDPGEDQDPTCTKCATSDDRYGKRSSAWRSSVAWCATVRNGTTVPSWTRRTAVCTTASSGSKTAS